MEPPEDQGDGTLAVLLVALGGLWTLFWLAAALLAWALGGGGLGWILIWAAVALGLAMVFGGIRALRRRR